MILPARFVAFVAHDKDGKICAPHTHTQQRARMLAKNGDLQARKKNKPTLPHTFSHVTPGEHSCVPQPER